MWGNILGEAFHRAIVTGLTKFRLDLVTRASILNLFMLPVYSVTYHEHFSSGIENIDDHLSLHMARNLHPPPLVVLGLRKNHQISDQYQSIKRRTSITNTNISRT